MRTSTFRIIGRLWLLLALSPACGCGLFQKRDLAASLNEHIERPFASSELLTVHFATNRAGNGRECSNQSFAARGSNELRFGHCEINVPKAHGVGSLPEGDGPYADPNRFFKIGRYRASAQTSFVSEIPTSGEVLLFVHGFNVPFEEAILRAAQIAFDAKFQGEVVLFTWPAGAEDVVGQVLLNATYLANRESAQASQAVFRQFLEVLLAGDRRVHLVVHSMGHQVVLPVVAALAREGREAFLGEVILNAPDFGTSDFLSIAPFLSKSARRVTLYCSPGDRALLASQQVNGNHRIGLCARAPGIEVINANEIDDAIAGLGHGYYAGRAIITEYFQILLGIETRRRLFIRLSDQGGGEDYILRR